MKRRASRSNGRDERRADLLDAAVRAVRKAGASVSMDFIASEAGITKPILYKHFGHRDGLVEAIADRFSAELLAAIRAGLGSAARPEDILRGTIDAYLSFVESDPQIYRFLITRGLKDDADRLFGFIRQIAGEIAVVVGEQLRDAGADSGAAEPWAYGMVGMVHLAGDWWLEHRSMPRARLVQYLSDLLWNGAAAHLDEARPPLTLASKKGIAK